MSVNNVKEIVTTGTEVVANTANKTYIIDKNQSLLPQPPSPSQQQLMMNAWTTTTLPTLQQPQPQPTQLDIVPQPVTSAPQSMPMPIQMPIIQLQPQQRAAENNNDSSSSKLAGIQMFKVDTSFGKSIPNAPAVTRENGAAGGQLLQFPWKLHEMLRLAEQNNKSDIISWLNGGNIGGIGVGFKVHKKDRFCSEIMPGYFASQKYKTFQRSLNLWGFESVAKGEERGACYHKFFVKGRPELCHNMYVI